MKKSIAFPVIAVLAIAIIVGGYILMQQTSKLTDARGQIAALTDNVSALQANVSNLQGNITTLQGEKGTLQSTVSNLSGNISSLQVQLASSQSDLKAANSATQSAQSSVASLQTLNSSLSNQIKTVTDPRHFATLAELTDWLAKDDTNTNPAYTSLSLMQKVFVLQVKALRAGYLLPASIDLQTDGSILMDNVAAIGDGVYYVSPVSDFIFKFGTINPVPSHPLPLP